MANVADMTVETEGGARYGADSIKVCRKDGEQGITFLCSGEPTFIPASEVERVEVRENEDDDGLCMTCLE